MKKKKILRIRPFNMANFSGGSGYLPIYAIFGFVFSFPITFFICLGMAAIPYDAEGLLDTTAIRKKLVKIILPLCVLIFGFLFYSLADTNRLYGDFKAYGFLIAWISFILTFGIFFSLLLALKYIEKKGVRTRQRFFLCTLGYLVLIMIIGVIGMIVFSTLGDSLQNRLR